jgi:hypothetical protein
MKKPLFLSLLKSYMKHLSALFFLIVLHFANANAQAAFETTDSVDINNIHSWILVHGDMWQNLHPNPLAFDSWHQSGCNLYGIPYYNLTFAGALWMSGYDNSGNLHISSQTYRQDGNDYWPGPLDSYDTLTYATSQKWNKIWKVNGTDVTDFLSLPVHTTVNTPSSILTWPARGNIYAQGNSGAPLTITDDMAPFVDLNSNSIYEPLLGEYPDFTGEQALWWVFSDNGPSRTDSGGHPLGIEVHAMAHAYKRGTLIDNVIYYDYTVINKSLIDYHNFRFA